MCNGGVVEGREQYMLEGRVEEWGGGRDNGEVVEGESSTC